MNQRHALSALLLSACLLAGCGEDRPTQTITSDDRADRPIFDIVWPYKQVNDFDRTRDPVNLRQVTHPTRANLDYALHHASGIHELAPFPLSPGSPGLLTTAQLSDLTFGILVPGSQHDRIELTPLGITVASRPYAWQPALEQIKQIDPQLADRLTAADSAVQSFQGPVRSYNAPPHQRIVALYLASNDDGQVQPWVKIEFTGGTRFIEGIEDGDHDGILEMYARLPDDHLSPAAIDHLQGQYATQKLDDDQIRQWAESAISTFPESLQVRVITRDDLTDESLLSDQAQPLAIFRTGIEPKKTLILLKK